MTKETPQRRIEEVAPGLVRIVDGSTYVYLSSGSPAISSGTLNRGGVAHAGAGARAMSRQGALNA